MLHFWKNAHVFRHCTPSLHNTARTGSTTRAWWSKYPAGLNLIHWGKLAWSCHHAQCSLKCMFAKNAGIGTWVAEVLFVATPQSHSANKRQKRLTPRSGMTRRQALSSEGFFQSMCKCQPGCVFFTCRGSRRHWQPFKVHTGCKCHPSCLQPKRDGTLLPHEP